MIKSNILLWNKLNFQQPNVLKDLASLEERLIPPRRLFMQVHKLPRGVVHLSAQNNMQECRLLKT